MEKSRLRVIIWNEFKRGNTAAETFRIINENEGKNVVSYATVTRWFAKFRVDDEKLEDKPRAGRPSKLDKDALRRKIEDDPHITIRELEELLNCGKSTIGDHLKAMGMVKKLDKWVPHNLTDLQKAKRRCASEKLLQRCKNEEFLDRIVTIDEKWISFNNTRRSTSWCKRGEAPKHVPKPELHEKKLMVTVWWCSSGVIQYDFMKPGQSITADTYCAQIDKLRHNLPTMVRRRGPIILQDNARPHAAKKTVAKFRELGYEVLEHPPYSPDLAPTDFHLFKHLSSFLNGRIFKTPDDAKNAFKNFINSRNPEFYNRGIKKLVNRWQDCIDSDGSVRVISKEILNMRHLTALFASHNLLKTIPAQINYLHHLSILDLSHNKLVALPRELGDIANLLHLNLSDNELASLPVELGKLYKIKTLNVSGNPLPKEVLSYGSTPHGSRNLQQYLLDSLSKTISKPPPRDWFAIKTLTNNGKPVAQFKVLCYNVLCDTYATPSLYSYCPLWALNWEYRKNIIMKEILTYDADILGLHEVEAEQFRVFYEPELKARGYDGIFSPKSRSKTMSKDNQKHVDGCALFWRTSKFKIRQQHLVEFAQIAINKSHQSEAIINRVMPKDNIALLATMEILPGIYVEPGQHPLNVKNDKVSSDKIDQNDQIIGTPLVLCAAHTHWDPEYCDVKLIQSMMLIHECAKQIEHTAKDFSLPLEEVPLIICGDFNSLPESGVVQYLINASVPKAHTDLKSFCNNIVLDGINTNEYDSTHYSHSLKLESSIDVNECINTNVTPDFKGMIDYILTTPHSLDRVGFLGGIWPNWIRENNLIGFPHPHVPSDHIPIMASYILKPRTERSPTRECKRFRRTSESFKKDMETRKK